MLSASHNPMPDNGIKFLARGGLKLDDAIEIAIERQLREEWRRPTGGDVGRVSTYDAAVDEYAAHLAGTVSRPLDGLRVVLDCAEGAAAAAGPQALRAAGAEVIAIHAEPDGLNINDNCGSTHLDDLQKAVVEHGADVGLRASTATPTGCWPWTPPAPSSTATSCSRSSRSPCASPATWSTTPWSRP